METISFHYLFILSYVKTQATTTKQSIRINQQQSPLNLATPSLRFANQQAISPLLPIDKQPLGLALRRRPFLSPLAYGQLSQPSSLYGLPPGLAFGRRPVFAQPSFGQPASVAQQPSVVSPTDTVLPSVQQSQLVPPYGQPSAVLPYFGQPSIYPYGLPPGLAFRFPQILSGSPIGLPPGLAQRLPQFGTYPFGQQPPSASIGQQQPAPISSAESSGIIANQPQAISPVLPTQSGTSTS